jgi:hypothetical protein
MFAEYSLWWIIPIFILSLLITAILYYFPKRSTPYSPNQKITLSILRFLAIFLSLALLLIPSFRDKDTIIQKPIIVIAQDNSSSLIMTKDSSFYKKDYLVAIEDLKKALAQDYDIKLMSFGSSAKEINSTKEINYTDYSTDVSEAIQSIRDAYSNLHLSSIILCTDGISNKGTSPLNTINDIQEPVFTIAMGDTTIKKDLSISEVRYNRIAYLNNQFPLEIVALSQKAKESKSVLRVKKDGATLFEEKFTIDNETFSKSFNTILKADKVGLQRYTISLQAMENEQTIINNTRDIFVEVLDGRQKVLILASSPSPDISAIKQAIEKNENYEVKSFLFNDFNASIEEYNIAILHQIPSNQEHLKLIDKLLNANIPILFIIGSQTNLSLYNTLPLGVKISESRQSQNSSTGIINSNFTLFSISKETQTLISQFPPLQVPFGKYNLLPTTQSLAFQKIGSITTNYPLIAFSNHTDNRIGTIFGEGFWKWRLQNYLINQTHLQADEIIQKSIQYLASKVDKSRFRVACDNIFAINQPIIIEAELYNDAYELVNEPEVKLIITNNQGKKYPFTFSKTLNAYHLNLGTFPSGKYNYTASTNYGGKAFSVNGTFYVSEQNLEGINLIADHNLLYNISEQTSATMHYPQEISKLKELIKQREDIKPLITQTITNKKLIDQWWYLSIIVLFFVLEWFLRKYWGKL